MNNLAPIIIFCYRRKINKLIKSLLKNKEAKYSKLIIFSDGYKSKIDKKDVLSIRKSIKKIKGFKSIKIIESKQNKGLAKSVIDGVNLILKNFGKAIILEDDLIVSKFFLNFMNQALNFYQNNNKIWSISGYSPPLSSLKKYNKDIYLSLRSSSWGWATWSDRWKKVDWSIKDFDQLKKNNKKIRKFNKGGNDMFKMLELQKYGKINSWAIRWCYAQFLNCAYSLTPKISMVSNKGFGSKYSTHTKGSKDKWEVNLSKSKINDFEAEINYKIINSFKKFHDLSFFTLIGYYLKKWGGYNLVKNKLKL